MDIAFFGLAVFMVFLCIIRFFAKRRKERMAALLVQIVAVRYANMNTGLNLRWLIVGLKQMPMRKFFSQLEKISEALWEIRIDSERERIAHLVSQAIRFQQPILMAWFGRKWAKLHSEIGEKNKARKWKEFQAALLAD